MGRSMRPRIVPFGVVVTLVAAPAVADSVPSDQSLANIALGQIPPSALPYSFMVPGIAGSLEKSLSEDLPNGDNLDLYAGYPGTPALGPEVDSPEMATLDGLQAPGGQGWLDQGFLAYGVVTAGFEHDDQQIEVSRFTGHNNFHTPYDVAHLDSTALRYTWKLDSNWSLQGSWGSLKNPEYFAPTIDEERWTASAKYTLPFGRDGSWSAMFAWGLRQESVGDNLNALAFDTECKPFEGWTVFAHGGLEQDNALLAGGALDPAGLRNSGTVSLGTVHDWTLFERVKVGAGGLYAFNLTPQNPTATPVAGIRGAIAYIHLSAQ